MPQENEATTILEIQVNDVTYDRLCRTAEAFGKKATVEDVVQAIIQWHIKAPYFTANGKCPDKLEPWEIRRDRDKARDKRRKEKNR